MYILYIIILKSLAEYDKSSNQCSKTAILFCQGWI